MVPELVQHFNLKNNEEANIHNIVCVDFDGWL